MNVTRLATFGVLLGLILSVSAFVMAGDFGKTTGAPLNFYQTFNLDKPLDFVSVIAHTDTSCKTPSTPSCTSANIGGRTCSANTQKDCACACAYGVDNTTPIWICAECSNGCNANSGKCVVR